MDVCKPSLALLFIASHFTHPSCIWFHGRSTIAVARQRCYHSSRSHPRWRQHPPLLAQHRCDAHGASLSFSHLSGTGTGSNSRIRGGRFPSSLAKITHRPMVTPAVPLSMSLVPVPVKELRNILPTSSRLAPNGEQYASYLGQTPRQRFNSLFEGASIAFLGSMFAYFISFVIGQFLATLLGITFLFWPILSPEFKAYQRNWELIGGRDLVDVWLINKENGDGYWSSIPEDRRGLYGAYYVARIEDVCVVDDVRAAADEEYDLEDFNSYTMATDELEGVTGLPWKLRLRLSDDVGRGMQVHSRMSEEYLDIRPGMNAVGVLLSTSRRFGRLAGMTDFCILDNEYGDAVAWVGDYPYLDKDTFLRALNENGITDSLLDFGEGEKYAVFGSVGNKREEAM